MQILPVCPTRESSEWAYIDLCLKHSYMHGFVKDDSYGYFCLCYNGRLICPLRLLQLCRNPVAIPCTEKGWWLIPPERMNGIEDQTSVSASVFTAMESSISPLTMYGCI